MNEREIDIAAQIRAIDTASNLRRANEVATFALARGLEHPAFHVTRARWLQTQERNDDALNELQKAFALAPRDVQMLEEIGLALMRVNRMAKAMEAFDAAIRIDPGRARTHFLKGSGCSAAGDFAAALRSHERAIALDPTYVDALAAASAAAVRAGDIAKSRTLAERALRLLPAQPTAAIATAMCDLQEGDYAHARTRLEALLPKLDAVDQTRALALGLLGDALDGEDRREPAFEAWTAKNTLLGNLYRSKFETETRLLYRVEQLIGALEAPAQAPAAPARAASAASPARQHVFLLGFMRSGTTLLEQMFAAHPDVESLEERETFGALAAPGLGGGEGLEKMSRWSSSECEQAREIYWQRVRAVGARPDGKFYLEKQPFNTLYLPLIATLFPSAKVIFMLRDPRNVILSCFRRHFEIKPTTYELLSLTSAARFYDRVMRLAEICRSRWKLDILECRYEDLVSDFENRVPAICRFVGMEWNESMRDFAGSARLRTIRSVSGNQVRQGLRQEGMGQWRRHKDQLAPILPVLRPWIERFGYAAE